MRSFSTPAQCAYVMAFRQFCSHHLHRRSLTHNSCENAPGFNELEFLAAMQRLNSIVSGKIRHWRARGLRARYAAVKLSPDDDHQPVRIETEFRNDSQGGWQLHQADIIEEKHVFSPSL